MRNNGTGIKTEQQTRKMTTRERKTETVRSTGGWRKRGISSSAERQGTKKRGGREQDTWSERLRDEQEGGRAQ